MDFSSLPLFGVMKAKMNYLSQRQSALAQNVANADTPDYQARDVIPPDFKSIAQGTSKFRSRNLGIAVTNPKHIAGSSANAAEFAVGKRASTYERNPNGNNVSIEQEMMLISNNQAEYQQVLGLYKKSVDLFKTALGKPGGA